MYMGDMNGDMSFDPGSDPMPMPEENAGMPVWGWILIVLGVLGAGAAALIVIKKKKAKKKAAQLTEEAADLLLVHRHKPPFAPSVWPRQP